MMFATIAAATAALLDPTTAAAPAPRETPQATAPASMQRYCVLGPVTGTIMPKRECRTRGEWIQRGFDPIGRK